MVMSQHSQSTALGVKNRRHRTRYVSTGGHTASEQTLAAAVSRGWLQEVCCEGEGLAYTGGSVKEAGRECQFFTGSGRG